MTVLLISILQNTNVLAVNKLISIEDSNDRVDDSKIIVNTNNKGSKIRFFTPRARFLFKKLRQTFNTTQILHHFKFNIRFRLILMYENMSLLKSLN